MAKEKKKGLVDVIIEFIPSLVLSIIIFPILGYISYEMYSTTILGSTNTVFNLILFLIIIGLNLIILLGVMYVANIFMKTNMKRHALVGILIIAFILGMTIYRYTLITAATAGSDEWEQAFFDFRFARGILIGYAAYFVITFFINRIAVVSIKNKKEKTSK